jgi:hypothetical protein
MTSGGAARPTAPSAPEGRLSWRERAAYATGSLGNNLVYGLITTYLLVFYTDVFALPAATVGTIFLLARVWDAVDDPFVGHLVDNTHTRWGRFRPYLLFGPFAMGAVVVAVFAAPDLSPTARVVWALATYLAWGLAFTFLARFSSRWRVPWRSARSSRSASRPSHSWTPWAAATIDEAGDSPPSSSP